MKSKSVLKRQVVKRKRRKNVSTIWRMLYLFGSFFVKFSVLVIGLIIVSLIVYTAIFSTEEFVAFWENFGRQLEEFFTSATFEQMAKLIGPVVLFLIGLAIILAAFRKK